MQHEDKIPFVEFIKAIGELNEKLREIESKKTPEQRAKEALQSQITQQAFRENKIKKEQARCDGLFTEWIKRDTWLIYDEAIPLITAEKPDVETVLNPRDSKLWALVLSCANHSLKVINFVEGKPKHWRIKPFEWVRWLKEKEWAVHPQLLNMIYPKIDLSPTIKTTKAINSRELIKAHRLKAIKIFCNQITELSRKANVDWNEQAIPVTKKEFLEAFHKLNPAIKKISADSFDRDIAEIGIKFQRGIKSNKNNKLKLIFNIS